jgi:signal transduction histidine kinase
MPMKHAAEPVGLPRATLTSLLISLAAVGAAMVLTLLLLPWLPHTQFILFYAAVMFAAALGGLKLAAIIMAVSMVAAEIVVIGGLGLPTVDGSLFVRHAVLLGVFLVMAVLVERLQRVRRRAHEALLEAQYQRGMLAEQATELEAQVAESECLTAELHEANRQLAEQAAAARRGADRAARLQRLTTCLLEAVGEGPVTRVVVREARRTVEAEVAALAVFSPDGDQRINVMDGTAGPGLHDASRYEPLLKDVAATGEALWFEDDAGLARRYPALLNGSGRDCARAVLPLTTDRGSAGAILFVFGEAGEFPADERWYMTLVAHECAQALERARLHGMGMAALVRAEFAERRLAFLAEASAELSASLDYRASLAALARMAVPEITDLCTVHLLDERGALQLVEVAHPDPAVVDACREIEALQVGATSLPGLHEVSRADGFVFIESVTEQHLRRVAQDDEHLDQLSALGIRSQLAIPIPAADDVCGMITLAATTSGRRFGSADITLAVELARRAGQVIGNARLYHAAHFASEAKSDFLAVISHELRTPLNAIMGYTDLLLLGIPQDLPDSSRRQVERIRLASDGLLQLVEEVLSFSRIEAGQEALRISPLDLSMLLRDVVILLTPMANAKSLELRLDLPDSPIRLVSDEHKIRQVATNLLSNAVKFTEHGTVTITAEASDAAVRVQVGDTGIGIAPEHLKRIFDPFWQVEHATTRRYGGTGLGLGVALKLVELLGGTLGVQSEVGKGSVFTLNLPLLAPLAARQQG